MYVVSRIDMPESRGEYATGFDVDGIRSDGVGSDCVARSPDYRSRERAGEMGIDNEASSLAPTAEWIAEERLATLFEQSIVDGRTVILVELATDEEGRRARILRGVPADGAIETGEMGVTAGQRFRIAEVLADVPVSPDCRAGAPRITTRVVPFTPAEVDVFPSLPLDTAQVTHVGFAVGVSVLREGRLGGSWAVEDLVRWATRTLPGLAEDDAFGVVSTVSDLDPDPSEPRRCRRISFGLSFEAVRAELVE